MSFLSKDIQRRAGNQEERRPRLLWFSTCFQLSLDEKLSFSFPCSNAKTNTNNNDYDYDYDYDINKRDLCAQDIIIGSAPFFFKLVCLQLELIVCLRVKSN